jgi:SanA protein
MLHPVLGCVVYGVPSVRFVASKMTIARASRKRTYADVLKLPFRRVGLVLGCPMKVYGGWPNPFFENRIVAAAEVYRHRKVEYLIASGDNHVQGYYEPTDMKNALVARGVPADRIYLDYAGFRTLDSVVRAKEVFGQVTIISQNFHNRRAIFLALHHGIDAIGLHASDVAPCYVFKTLLREQFAEVKAALAIFALRAQPHFLGQKIVVGNSPTA